MESKTYNQDTSKKGSQQTYEQMKPMELPKSYIGQESVKKKHKRSKSLTEGLSEMDDIEENNPYRFNTDRKIKRVTFNQKIHIINIHNYKNENKILYYDKNNPENEEEVKKENKCLSCMIY